MLERLIHFSLRQRLLTFLGALFIAGWGAASYLKLPIDAFPDVAPIQVLVAMRAPGLTPEELETRVTAPIEIAAKGIPSLIRMRSTTRYSVALITFEFAEGVDIYWARAQVNERLSQVLDQLPAGAGGGLAPIVTPLGEMLMFTIVGGNLTPTEQRSLLDFTIRPALRGLQGVADVNVLGGFVRTFEVAPSPSAMAARGVTVGMLEAALKDNNRNDGAGRVRDGEEALLVRAEGRLRSLDEIRSVVIAARATGIVRVGDVAEVRFGSLPRNGVVTRNGTDEAVWGLVLGLRGADARTVVTGVKAKLAEIEPLLPKGAKLEIFYDRSELIGKAVWTVQKVLIEAIVLVVILLALFLGNLRAALVVSVILPLAALATFGVMRLWGLSANIMSLGGLAIAIGLLVDCAVVVVENVEHRLSEAHDVTLADRIFMTLEATSEVATPLASGVIIIVTVFLPLLSLEGLEGRLFAPVALTIAFALASALILSLTVVPALSATILQPGHADEPWLVRKIAAVYEPLLERALARPLIVAGIALAGLVVAGVAYSRIGQTFMPVMNEGTPVITIRKHPTISVAVAAETDRLIQREIMEKVPEVKGMMARAGADELGIDPVGLNETDNFLTLAPEKEWRGHGVDWLMGEIRKVLDEIPGISYAFSQPIDMRVQEMIIGARGDVVVKIFGDDINELNRLTREVATELKKIPGARDVFGLQNDGMRYLTARVDRLAAGRFGLNAGEIQDALRVWVDGQQVGIILEGPIRTPLVVRGSETSRRSSVDFARLPMVSNDGKVVELSQLAEVQAENGPIQVIREEGRRFATVLANVEGRDLVGFVDEAKAAVAHHVKTPKGYTYRWGGQFENQQRASARLAIVVPIALAMIFVLLYFTFNSALQATLVFCNVPFAAIGGVLGLWLSGEFLSVPASVGFIALIGIAVLNGVVLISYINKLVGEGTRTVRDAVMEGARRRMRPVMLTATIAAFGLIPFLFATGPGAEIQRPLAIVVIGGLISATILTLILLPILYDRSTGWLLRAKRGRLAHRVIS
ncbi:efflux RND transporter permease subunit [Methylocystis parvus]|uniref:Efflux RND transporter permease subunit n=1 Tax=Methylocystis parvus TaxID=134 RepID=A0A6B8M9T6_9HYPH|nr:CusA/CzcA family heavy metal efflux RND transporter [Methylocystis parvus]QGM98359.1 efflux RND transporter permease subunit [Methylocystis parvus]WBK01313.1 CusA/CzcA family heavy metal efflux RND transporter [Methylocystis parvus OBBP]